MTEGTGKFFTGLYICSPFEICFHKQVLFIQNINDASVREYTEEPAETVAGHLLRPGCSGPSQFFGTPFSLRKLLSPQNPRNCVLLGDGSDVDSQRQPHRIISSPQFTRGP